MATALSRPVRLRLEQALAQWPHWDLEPALSAPPRVLRPLGSGLSNHSFLLEAQGRQFVLRLDGLNPRDHGLNRQTEWRVLRNARAAGLAPAPRYCNPELGALVCDYLPPAPRAAEDIPALAALLRAIHALPAIHARLDLAERSRRYEHTLQASPNSCWRELAPLAQPAARVLQRASALAGPLVLCHNDLLRSNRLYSGGRLWAVDWEYAAMGSAWFDLAGILAGDEWPEPAGRALLHAYLGQAPQPQQLQALALFDAAYRYLELLWYAQPTHSADTDFWPRKLALLQQRLQDLGAQDPVTR